RVEFFLDSNGNGKPDAGESLVTSPTFYVGQKQVYSFGLWYSSVVGVDPSGRIAQELSDGTRILLSRDSEDDCRAIVKLRLDPKKRPHMFTAGPGMPDPVFKDADEENLFAGAPNWTIIAVSIDVNNDGQAEWYGGTPWALIGGAN